MIRETVANIDGYDVVALDSASQITSQDSGRIVVAGSNGGRESGRAAVLARCAAIVLNDAGIGKDRAGVAGLALADEQGIPGMTVSHESAEISDGLSTWRTGRISVANEAAARRGVASGMTVAEAVHALCRAWEEERQGVK